MVTAPDRPRGRAGRSAFIRRATLGYAVFALVWIFFSDRILNLLADADAMAWLSTAKGGLFVVVTAALLYFFLLTVPDRDDGRPAASLLETMAAPPAAGRWHPLALYGFALAVTAATVALRMALAPTFGDRPLLILFMLPIVLSALLGGLGPGLLATAVAALSVNFLAVPQPLTAQTEQSYDLLQWSFLLAAGLLVSVLSEGLRRSRLRMETQHLLLDAVVAGSQDAIFVKDRQGRYLLCNDSAARFFGRRPGDLLGQDDRAVLPPDTAALLMTQDRSIMESAQPSAHEETLTNLEGQTLTFLVHKGPLFDQAGRVVGLFGISRDITERKRAEDEIQRLNADLERQVHQRTAELEQANDALLRSNLELRHFAHAAAHDLQTPLRSIAGFAQLLRQKLQGRLDAEGDQWLAYIIDNTKRLQTLIQELLAYSRLDVQGRPFEPVDLGRICGEVLTTLKGPIEEAGAEVTCCDLPTVRGDRYQLAQLLQNLVENGLKYNAAKPPRVALSCRRQGDDWELSVADNGIGIDPRHHERIFEMFRRLHTYGDIPGSGIGLASCRRIVERHGGRIWVESRPGEGSIFRFTLPA
ncbi:MAG TPA: ATP-binding protein [Rhodocyclaceae bacterium]|nr:ATP-binding protein [Rhodocyclaceae bacterium]